jgi:ribosomal protein S18 acetylase RimI-like enzyme
LIAAGGLVLAECDDHLAGFGAIDVQAAEQIKYIYVAPQFQNAGIGTRLLDRLETIGRAAGLQTITLHANPPAVAFYHRAGYNPVESESHHDHDGVVMMKWL